MTARPLERAPKYSHVTVLCPAHAVTGGPEALHQLVDAINRLGGSASICYWPADADATIPAPYRHYRVPVVRRPVEGRNAAIVAPEIWPNDLRDFACGAHVFWWLSVDHFMTHPSVDRRALRLLASVTDVVRHHRVNALRAAFRRKVIAPLRYRFPQFWTRTEWVHATQSGYAYRYVSQRLASKPHMLTDYIPGDYISAKDDAPERIARVVYNPAKGGEFTRIIREACPDLQFVPVRDLSAREVATLLRTSAAYIDFGSHPGRDRLPREAALNGAAVVVGLRGSAQHPEDCPLPDRYRVSVEPLDRAAVCTLLTDILANPGAHAAAQKPYRAWASDQERVFLDEVQGLFFASV